MCSGARFEGAFGAIGQYGFFAGEGRCQLLFRQTLGPLQIGCVQVGTAQVRPAQLGIPQVGPRPLGFAHVSISQLRPGHVDDVHFITAKVYASRTRSPKVSTPQVGAP